MVYGTRNGFPSEINSTSINGDIGLTIHGGAAADHLGSSVSYAGDVNGDGLGDVVIGAPRSDPGGRSEVRGCLLYQVNDGI